MQPLPHCDAADSVDRAEQHETLERELALRHHHARRDATPQVSLGGEIVCCDCGAAIPQHRLDAVPHAARCVDCQGLYERER